MILDFKTSIRSSMKMAFLIFFVVGFGYTASAQTSPAEEKILVDLEKLRVEAINEHNYNSFSTIYHDQFRGVTTSGKQVDKKGLIEIIKSPGPERIVGVDDLKASIYGYAGVTSGMQVTKDKSGTIVDQLRFMHVYIKRNGQWKLIEGQYTSIKE